MTLNFENRYALGPNETKNLDTRGLRDNFLIENLFQPGKISFTYSHYDRFMVGGCQPAETVITLETIDELLKMPNFLDRREIGIINIGGSGKISVDGEEYEIAFKDALYIGKGAKSVQFSSVDPSSPAKFYLNSTPAHQSFPTRKVTKQEANQIRLGTVENSNKRTINQILLHKNIDTCQLQMGLTELDLGSVWNTMPVHTHDRRMEAYLYFELDSSQAVSHFMGTIEETRHIWVKNEEAVLSPPWSIHSGAGTSNYSFIWGMAGENLDYDDMDKYEISAIK